MTKGYLTYIRPHRTYGVSGLSISLFITCDLQIIGGLVVAVGWGTEGIEDVEVENEGPIVEVRGGELDVVAPQTCARE